MTRSPNLKTPEPAAPEGPVVDGRHDTPVQGVRDTLRNLVNKVKDCPGCGSPVPLFSDAAVCQRCSGAGPAAQRRSRSVVFLLVAAGASALIYVLSRR